MKKVISFFSRFLSWFCSNIIHQSVLLNNCLFVFFWLLNCFILQTKNIHIKHLSTSGTLVDNLFRWWPPPSSSSFIDSYNSTQFDTLIIIPLIWKEWSFLYTLYHYCVPVPSRGPTTPTLNDNHYYTNIGYSCI